MKKVIVLFMCICAIVLISACNSNQKLNKEEELYIKNIYANYYNKNNNDKINASDVNVKYFFGEYHNAYIVVIEGDLGENAHYEYYCSIPGESMAYWFRRLPEIISVYYEGEYYTLNQSQKLNIFSSADIKKIHEEYWKIVEELEKEVDLR